MLGLVTTLEDLRPQPVDSQIEVKPLTEYIINTLNIQQMEVYNTHDSLILYKLNRHEDRTNYFELAVEETNAAIQILADVDPESNLLPLDVFEGALTFADCADITTTAKMFNIDEIVWIEENNAGTISMLWLCEGGWNLFKIFADHNIGQIVDLNTTGTTSTTTTSTSTTSTTTAEAEQL